MVRGERSLSEGGSARGMTVRLLSHAGVTIVLDYFNATNTATIGVYSDSQNWTPTMVMNGMTFWWVHEARARDAAQRTSE